MAGPLGRAEEQHLELLQIPGRARIRLSRLPVPQQGGDHSEYPGEGSFQSRAKIRLMVYIVNECLKWFRLEIVMLGAAEL